MKWLNYQKKSAGCRKVHLWKDLLQPLPTLLVHSSFKTAATHALQAAILLFGLGVFAFMLVEPHFEGRNVNATPFEIYFKDPFLAFAYLASVPFFMGLVQLWKLSGHAGRRELFLPHSLKPLRTLRNCALTTVVCIAIGTVWLLMVESDDRPPIVMMGMVTMLISVAVTTLAGVLEKRVRG